jgi:hypothetical protein
MASGDCNFKENLTDFEKNDPEVTPGAVFGYGRR